MTPMDAAALLAERFGPGPDPVVVRAPGRVNLIGEHTDYNEGYVLPVAVDRYTEVALRPRHDGIVRVFSSAFGEIFHVELPLRDPRPAGKWHDYLLGVLREFARLFDFPHGFDAAILSDVPLGAGLSSSASLEVAFAVGLVRLFGFEIGDLALVELCQRAERDFVGMPCGIMDQFVSYFGREGHAVLLDTRSLVHRYVPLRLPDVALLVVDSGVRRTLAGSGYAQRRRECEEAVGWLARRFPEKRIRALRDVSREMLEDVREEMPRVLWKRASHVVEENWRVLEAVGALEVGDPVRLGKLLYASHASLRDLFEVSTPELDFLVEWGVSHGALGARLVGGGFGGVTLHLIPRGEVGDYAQGLADAYRKHFDAKATAIEVSTGSGAWKFLRAR